MSDVTSTAAVFWVKVGFCIGIFFEGMVSGMIPTWSTSCRESPKILGIANSFAGGVFLAIAFMHITPEMIEDWDSLPLNQDSEKIFPLPELLIFTGYTIILIIDKVLFDTHALFAHDDHEGGHEHAADPASAKLENNLKASMARSAQLAQKGDVKASLIAEREGTQDAMKAYLNPHDRFATRMKASMNRPADNVDEQAALFVDGGNVDLNREKGKCLPNSLSP